MKWNESRGGARQALPVRGFSLLELVVVISVVAVASLFFFDRVLLYQEMAEKSAVDLTLMHLKNGVRYRTAELLMRGQEKDVAGLEGANAMRWVEAPPPGYIGELRHPQWDEVAPGSWYFDMDKGEIVYRVKRGRHFVAGTDGRQILRFRVIASTRRSTPDASVTLAEGVRLTSLEKYQWF